MHLDLLVASWASGNISGDANIGGLIGVSFLTAINNWASGNVSGNLQIGGLMGTQARGINGRNYQLDDAQGTGVNLANVDPVNGHSFVLGGTVSGGTVTMGSRAGGLTALAGLSGDATTSTNYGTHSGWHAGFDSANPVSGTNIDLKTKYCDTNGNGMIDDGTVAGNPNERTANNSVWVMGPTANDNVTTNTNEAGVTATYYQIPAIRCIANTKGITDQTKIDEMRKIEIDRQRRLFRITQ